MFDAPRQAQPDALSSFLSPDWAVPLRPGDLVRACFPMRSSVGPFEPKPCLVLDLERRPGEAARVLLTPGFSRDSRACAGLDVFITDPAEIAIAGLDRHYRFDGRLRLSVAVTNKMFLPVEGTSSARLGRVSGSAASWFERAHARIIAEADIAAWRRAERLRESAAGSDDWAPAAVVTLPVPPFRAEA